MKPFVLVVTDNYRVVMNAVILFPSPNSTQRVPQHRIEVKKHDALGGVSWHNVDVTPFVLEEIFQAINNILGDDR